MTRASPKDLVTMHRVGSQYGDAASGLSGWQWMHIACWIARVPGGIIATCVQWFHTHRHVAQPGCKTPVSTCCAQDQACRALPSTQCDTGTVTVVTSVLELDLAFSSIANLTAFTYSLRQAIATRYGSAEWSEKG